jgi:hypothetical protein
MGLRTIIWNYDSFDWKAGSSGVTAATIDQNYQNLISQAQNGNYSTVSETCSPLLDMKN